MVENRNKFQDYRCEDIQTGFRFLALNVLDFKSGSQFKQSMLDLLCSESHVTCQLYFP